MTGRKDAAQGRLWRPRVAVVALAYVALAAALAFAVMRLAQVLALPNWVDDAALLILAALFVPTLWLAWSGAAAAEAPPPKSHGVTIAVLPFESLSRDVSDEVFADGLVEDLLSGLAMSSTLTVISRLSTFGYKGQTPDVRQVGRDLGAQFVLEGSVRRTGERLSVTVKLVEAREGSHVWVRKYERPLADLFELQDDLIREIAAELGDAVVDAELKRLKRNPKAVSAWEESMRAMFAQERPTLEYARAAIAHARKAVKLDPDFAIGHARLAGAAGTLAMLVGGDEAKRLFEEAETAIDRAIDLSPDDPKVLSAAAGVMGFMGRAEEAIRHGARARALNPHDAHTLGSYANAHFCAGRYAEAVELFAAEAAASPHSPFLAGRCVFHAAARIMLGELDKAEAVLLRGLQLDPAYEAAWLALAVVRALRGDPDGAREAVRNLRRLNPTTDLNGWIQVIEASMPAPGDAAAVTAFRQAWGG